MTALQKVQSTPETKNYTNRFITVKSTCFSKKNTWGTLPNIDIPGYFLSFENNDIINGDKALYMQPAVRNSKGKIIGSWLIWDIEDSKNHKDIQSNINCAQKLFYDLILRNLLEGLQIYLTGTGFRFVWPILIPVEYLKDYRHFVKQHSQIDKASLNLDHFQRMNGYRWNRKQGINPEDKHLHKLNKASDLLILTEEKYKTFVAGKPNPNDCFNWIEENFLPTQDLPLEWIKVLKEEKINRAFKNSIVANVLAKNKDKFATKYDTKTNWILLEKHLENIEIHSIDEVNYKDCSLIRLSSCPSCGKQEGSPFLTQTGRLKCFRTSCTAGDIKENGRIKGLAPQEWVPEYYPFKTLKDIKIQNIEENYYLSKYKARNLVIDGIRNSEDNTIIQATAGLGKTTMAIEAALELTKTQIVLYSAPTRALAKEVKRKTEICFPEREDIYLIEGRCKKTCIKIKKIMEVSKKGFWPGVLTCPECSQRDTGICPYYLQFKIGDTGLIIAPHDSAIYIEDLLKVKTWIIDENPRDSFVKEKEVNINTLNDFRGYPKSNNIILEKINAVGLKSLDEIKKKQKQDIAEGKKDQHYESRLYITKAPTGSQWEHSTSLWEIARITAKEFKTFKNNMCDLDRGESETLKSWQTRIYDAGINMNTLTFLLIATGVKKGTAYIKINKGIITLVNIEKQIPALDCRIINLDATANPQELESLLSRKLRVVNAQVKLSNCNKIWLHRGLGKIKANKLSEKKIARMFEREVGIYIGQETKKILIATHKVLETHLEAVVKAWIKKNRPDLEYAFTHFWASRGVNTYEDFDTVLCFGTPTASPAETRDKAMLLFDTEEERAEWQSSLGTADLIQTVSRVRPINGNKKIIILGSEWPAELGTPDKITDLRRLGNGQGLFAKAEDRIQRALDNTGFVTKETMWRNGFCERGEESLMQEAFSDIKEINKFIEDTKPDSKEREKLIKVHKKVFLFETKPEEIVLRKGTYSELIKKILAKNEMYGRLSHKGVTKRLSAIGNIDEVEKFYCDLDCLDLFNYMEWKVEEEAKQPMSKPIIPQEEKQEAVMYADNFTSNSVPRYAKPLVIDKGKKVKKRYCERLLNTKYRNGTSFFDFPSNPQPIQKWDRAESFDVSQFESQEEVKVKAAVKNNSSNNSEVLTKYKRKFATQGHYVDVLYRFNKRHARAFPEYKTVMKRFWILLQKKNIAAVKVRAYLKYFMRYENYLEPFLEWLEKIGTPEAIQVNLYSKLKLGEKLIKWDIPTVVSSNQQQRFMNRNCVKTEIITNNSVTVQLPLLKATTLDHNSGQCKMKHDPLVSETKLMDAAVSNSHEQHKKKVIPALFETKLEGKIVDILKVDYRTQSHTVAVVRNENGVKHKFYGYVYAKVGRQVSLSGKFIDSSYYGWIFKVSKVNNEDTLQWDKEGLILYLSKHPSLGSVGASKARKIVETFGCEGFEKQLLKDYLAIAQKFNLSDGDLNILSKCWESNIEKGLSNKLYAYLSAFGFTNKQVNRVLDRYSYEVVHFLEGNVRFAGQKKIVL